MSEYADIGAWRAHNAHGQLFPCYRAKDSCGGVEGGMREKNERWSEPREHLSLIG